MAETHVGTDSTITLKKFSAAMFAKTQLKRTFTNRYTGPAPQQKAAEKKLRSQTSADYPIIRLTDLKSGSGDKLSVDLFHDVGGFGMIGDVNGEGKGENLTFTSQELKIDLLTHVVNSGGKMSRQRTVWNLRSIALANLANWFANRKDQETLVHMAGARGDATGQGWNVPLQSDPDFAEHLINPVMAPSYARHFVAKDKDLVRGGKELGNIDTTSVLALEHIDEIGTMLMEDYTQMQPIKVVNDEMAEDEPLFLMLVSYRAWNDVKQNTADAQWRTFLQNAWNRANNGSKHPLFTGAAGLWNNIYVKQMQRNIRFNPGSTTKYIEQADRYTATESDIQVNPAMAASGFNVDRCIILGGQAIAHVFGENDNYGLPSKFMERRYNFKRHYEHAGDMMGGCGKLRFKYKDDNGKLEPVDHGVTILDVAASGNYTDAV